MSNIRYSIQFFSPWHCGSGLSAGADVDALVIKDKNDLPYIPGKTLKGLIREAVEDYASLSNTLTKEALDEAFGLPADADNTDDSISGSAFFTNATLDDREAAAIIGNHAQSFLLHHVSSTAIGDDGVADDHSLRSIETVVPCTLHAAIYDLPDDVAAIIEQSFGMIHHIGVNRSRGLGRCDFHIEKGGER